MTEGVRSSPDLFAVKEREREKMRCSVKNPSHHLKTTSDDDDDDDDENTCGARGDFNVRVER